MRPGDLAPDHPDVGAADLTLGPVDESDLLAQVEGSGLRVVNTLDLDQAVSISDPILMFNTYVRGWLVPGAGVDAALATLVAQVATPAKQDRINPLSSSSALCDRVSIHRVL